MNLKSVTEGILFVVGDEGITLKELSDTLGVSESEVKEILSNLRHDYESNERGLRISFLGNTFKLTTKSEHKMYYEKLVTDSKTFTLSNASLEVLAIIAYNEPITRVKIDEIRGVSSSQIVRKLLARGFIKECGKDNSIGKPNLYKTTNEFLDYFGLATKEDLPKLDIKDSPVDNSEVELYKSNYKEND
ncbi:MAG TPA: SMC-Scp complex subunit ScpB [Firmicutes bacterium]|jgi:segregation and condensation protein B|nr:SMC-Scp complex subunit ScpB [Bacillota bacterium]